jgi:hypothetical protein
MTSILLLSPQSIFFYYILIFYYFCLILQKRKQQYNQLDEAFLHDQIFVFLTKNIKFYLLE